MLKNDKENFKIGKRRNSNWKHTRRIKIGYKQKRKHTRRIKKGYKTEEETKGKH